MKYKEDDIKDIYQKLYELSGSEKYKKEIYSFIKFLDIYNKDLIYIINKLKYKDRVPDKKELLVSENKKLKKENEELKEENEELNKAYDNIFEMLTQRNL